MKPAAFTYHRAHDVDETVELLTELGEDAKILAGGQSLVALMNFRLARPSALIDITRIPGLDYLRRDVDGTDGLRIGALTTHRTVEKTRLPEVRAGFDVLPRAARWIGHYPIRCRGTFGGSIAHGDPPSEWCLLAVLLEAVVVLHGQRGRREVPATEFLHGFFTTAAEPDEMVVEIRFPRPARDHRHLACRRRSRRRGHRPALRRPRQRRLPPPDHHPRHPRPRRRRRMTWVGARVPRKEDRRMLLGRERFVDDLERQGTLHAAFARSPFGSAAVGTIDPAEALRAPGVRHVFTWASRSTVVSGSAVHNAALAVKERAIQVAARMGRAVTLAEVAQACQPGSRYLLPGEPAGLSARRRFEVEHMTYPYGVHVAVAEVDPGTGRVRVLRYLVAYEVERAINPMMVEGQLAGGVAQGVGGALLEEFGYDESGQPQAVTFMDYLLPTAAEVPKVDVLVTEDAPSPGNPLGVKGAGEGGLTAAGAALANAVRDALGLRGSVERLPMTAARVSTLSEGKA